MLGSALANTLAAAGYDVTREYYINDAGSQMEAFYRSVWTRYRQALGHDADMPENGYQGDYIADIASEIIDADGDATTWKNATPPPSAKSATLPGRRWYH